MSTRIAFLMMLLVSLSAFAQPLPEVLDGELWVIEDDPAGRQYALRTDAHGTLALKLDASQGELTAYWQQMKTGMRVRVRGVRQGNTLLMASPYALDLRQHGEAYQEHLLPNTTGTHTVLLILAQYSNTGPAYTPAFAQTRLAVDVSSAMVAFSYGQLTFTVTTTAWLAIPLTNSTCNFLLLSDLADAAATTAGYALGSYQHLVYGFSFTSACAWAGLSTVGGAPSRAWLNGPFAVKTAVHELGGHSLGLFHSHARDCGSVIVTTLCLTDELGDWLDTMGHPTPIDHETGSYTYPHFNAAQKEHLGWLGPFGQEMYEIISSGVYHIGAYARGTDEPKALKLPYASLPGRSLYVEAKRPFNTDTFLEDHPLITNGVVLHLSDPDDGTTSELLDAHPATATWDDAALRIGEVFEESGAGFQLYVRETSVEGATVAVDREEDSISLTLLTPWLGVWSRGDTLSIQVLVQVGDQPADGGLWEWGVDIPGYGFFLQPETTLGDNGIWTLEVPLTDDLPAGWYHLYARASWYSKITPIVSGDFVLL